LVSGTFNWALADFEKSVVKKRGNPVVLDHADVEDLT
jgi:hypothetical protein